MRRNTQRCSGYRTAAITRQPGTMPQRSGRSTTWNTRVVLKMDRSLAQQRSNAGGLLSRPGICDPRSSAPRTTTLDARGAAIAQWYRDRRPSRSRPLADLGGPRSQRGVRKISLEVFFRTDVIDGHSLLSCRDSNPNSISIPERGSLLPGIEPFIWVSMGVWLPFQTSNGHALPRRRLRAVVLASGREIVYGIDDL